MSDKPKIRTSLLGRTISTAKLSSRLGMGAARKLLNTRDMNPEKAVEVAVKLANEFDGMKGLMMKFGQMASYLGTHMSPEARKALETLQASSTAMEFTLVREIVERELGKPLEDCFDTFEKDAFAAASIGQVHRASVNGRAVAVKVQYPDIERLISIDLRLVGNLFTALTLRTGFDGRAMAQELRERLMEECDYLNEANNQAQIGALWNTLDDTKVPEVIHSHCSRRVLTSELVEGKSFREFCDTAGQAEKDKAGLVIFRNTMDAIFKHCFFNGDPHPGNYLFRDNGDVVFLDFGCVKKFDIGMIHRWQNMAKTILEDDKASNWGATVAMGLVGKPKKFDHDFHWQMMNHVYKPFKKPTVFTYNREHIKETNRLMIWENKNKYSSHMPADFLFINRLQWGLAAVLADLNATNDWSPIFKGAVYAQPEPLFT